jgi:hypothetical protein
MASPDFETVNPKQWEHFVGVPSCDDDHTGAAIGDYLLQEFGDSGIGACLLAIEAEWRESTVIVEQKRGLR